MGPLLAIRRAGLRAVLVGSCGLLAASLVRADGLADLQSALGRLKEQQAVRAQLEISSYRRQVDDGVVDEANVSLTLLLAMRASGLSVHYGPELLARQIAEALAVSKDAEARQALSNLLRETGTASLVEVLTAAQVLSRSLGTAVFRAEAVDDWAGKPARRLSFEIPARVLPRKDRKYVKDFRTSLDVWIDAEGMPLASTLRSKVAGRAFLVVSFERELEQQRSYAVVDDRLIVMRAEERTRASGAGSQLESRTLKVLNLLAPER
ncbi:hypothetical protein [Roseateles violae]|uniref:Lipoprotein n=1 Tax=Roseateles violae TaxID=3058042 RepID=A0ABT8DT47_9BURK|nr:hypothetical protein [Pelomonas sp. PFR6]MDN3921489.1 hypothetical protein [Pelomonas sp. PFR6]